jgi:pectin methylesterase-like acyl-CoA thioesterase
MQKIILSIKKLLVFGIVFISCNSVPDIKSSNIETTAVEPLFVNSIVSTDIDFIKNSDPDVFKSLTYMGQIENEMPDNRNSILMDKNSYVFEASFTNGSNIGIWCHSSFGSKSAAEQYAVKLCPRLGKLPESHLRMLDHVVIHKGDNTAFAETEGHFFVLYSDNMDMRINSNDLEETVFHESVHATIQNTYKESKVWKNAQLADGNFITTYAKKHPDLEDLPETALFAYTMIKFPERLSISIEEWIKKNTPNRLAFFKTIY